MGSGGGPDRTGAPARAAGEGAPALVTAAGSLGDGPPAALGGGAAGGSFARFSSGMIGSYTARRAIPETNVLGIREEVVLDAQRQALLLSAPVRRLHEVAMQLEECVPLVSRRK